MKKGKFNIIMGGQAGSEAKGKASAFIAEKFLPDLIFMASSPNAGHTVVMDPVGGNQGKKFVTYHLPSAMVTCVSPVILGPSSLINPQKFMAELSQFPSVRIERVFVDRRAAIIGDDNIVGEKNRGLSDIGSTLQGVGTTRMSKMMRGAGVLFADSVGSLRSPTVDTSTIINAKLDDGITVWCEMTQGFDLDLEHGIHPRYCTSKMINPAMALAEAGVSPHLIGDIYGVIRPYPIRVSNRTGTSGPYAESKEITWEDVAKSCGAPSPLGEITTTTKLPRRVFEFSWSRFEHFIRVCRPDFLILQFANYIDWSNYQKTRPEDLTPRTHKFIEELEKTAGCRVAYVGTGPNHSHMIDMGVD